MIITEEHFDTIVGAMCSHVETQGDNTAFTFLKSDNQIHSVSYRELDERARGIAYSLLQNAEPGCRALMMYPAGLDFIEAFLGCVYAGIVAVPAYPPKKNRNAERVLAIAADCSPSLLLCTTETKCNIVGEFAASVAGASLVVTDELDGTIAGSLPKLRSDQLAFLQYTSGSTAAPKGVMVTHGNIVANEMLIQKYFEFTEESIMVSWLPMFHDMGLIGGILAPLFVGFPSVLMAPNSFLREPINWLRAVSEYRGTCTGAPNFAYDLCVKKITNEQKRELDLSSLRIAYNGAEPVRDKTLERFSEAFAKCGFRRDAFFPCYGMAETTLLVSGGPPLAVSEVMTVDPSELAQHRIVDAEKGQPVVSCGQVGPDLEVRIVDPESSDECKANDVGEIWVHGASVASGYWNHPDETRESFRATLQDDDREWFRTGDYGVLRGEELYVTGRLKDLIIIRGRNLYPQDIEQLVEQHLDFVEPNSCAAFSIENDGEEKLVVVAEGTRDMVRWAKSDAKYIGELVELNQIIDDLRAAILDEFEVALTDLAFVRPTTFPRTSSGKVQRRMAKRMLADEEFHVVLESAVRTQNFVDAHPVQGDEVFDLIRQTLREWASDEGQSLPALVGNTTFTSLGIDSLTAADISFRIEQKLGRSVELQSVITARTIEDLAGQFSQGNETTESAASQHDPRLEEPPCTSSVLGTIPLEIPVTGIRDLLREKGIVEVSQAGKILDQHANRQAEDGLGLNGCVIKESSNSSGIVDSGMSERECIIWCINHYTGLNRHPVVIDASKTALDRFGTGSGTSAVSGGKSLLHEELEELLSTQVGKTSVTLFPTGYTANTGAISAIAGPRDLILYDRESHASIIDGLRLCPAKALSFSHNSVDDLESKLKGFGSQFENTFVVNESVYSMSGDFAPLREIAELKDKYNFVWYVDEAHAFGFYGEKGGGLCDREGVTDRVDLIMSTLSKATATIGGFVATGQSLAALIRHYSRPYMFQACIPPSNVAATIAALRLLQDEPRIVAELHKRNAYMRRALMGRGFDFRSSESPIVPVYIPDDSAVQTLSKELFSHGVFTVPVYYPAVERGEGRLRFIVTRNHTIEQIDRTVEVLDQIVPRKFRGSSL